MRQWPCPQGPHKQGRRERCQHREPRSHHGTCRKCGEDRKGDAQMVADLNTRKRARNVTVRDFDSRISPPPEAVLFGQAGALPCGTSDMLTGSCSGHRKLWWPQAPGSVDKCPTGPHRNKWVCDQVRKDQTLAALGKEKSHVQTLKLNNIFLYFEEKNKA